MTERRTGGDRRKHKLSLRSLVRENAYRDVWLLIITGVSLWAVLLTQQDTKRIEQGRRESVGVICASTSAVIDAGRATITGAGSTGFPARFTRNLERLGYPPHRLLRKQSLAAARLYGQAIARRVVDQSGVRGVVKANGTLDCAKLEHLAGIK